MVSSMPEGKPTKRFTEPGVSSCAYLCISWFGSHSGSWGMQQDTELRLQHDQETRHSK